MRAPRGIDAAPSRYVGVDIGATKTAVAIGSADGTLLRQRVAPTVLGEPERLADAVADAMRELAAEDGPGEAPGTPIGIGICGGVDRAGLVFGPIALGWRGRIDFAGLIAERTGAPTYVENDVNAGALAEHRWGAGRGADDFMYLSIGTGIGAGLVLRGSLYRGANHLAGELGHMSVDVNGALCACGNRGCVEASCGGKPGGQHLVDRLVGADSAIPTTLRAVLERRGFLTTRDVFEQARDGDAFAEREVERMALHLTAAIVNVVNLLDVERVVVGGGQIENGQLLPAIERRLRSWRPYLERTSELVVPAALGPDAGVVGAIAVAMAAHTPDRTAAPSTEPPSLAVTTKGGGAM
jgi:glucokinase